MKLYKKFLDNKQDYSFTTKLRRKRFALFKLLIKTLPLPLKIIDIGGTQEFWETMNFCEEEVEIWLFNINKINITKPNFRCVVGDARNLNQLFRDKEFDVVFSNSLIEHIVNYDEQCKVAKEIERIGKRYFIQTPNKYFPIEPHFLFPFFQYLPQKIQLWLLTCLGVVWFGKIIDRNRELEILKSIRLLTEKELKEMFPYGTIFKEKILGLTKSFVIHNMA